MAYDYRPIDRDQGFLIPPDIREWLDKDHVAWLVLEAVAAMDTSAFSRARPGRKNTDSAAGKRGYDPDLLLGLLIYAYCVGERSSRRIEKLCQTDVAFRVLCGNDIPDHSVIARFRQRHDSAFADLFTQVLMLCADSGMGNLGRVALDGTKIAANASKGATRSESSLRAAAREMIDDAYAVDRSEEAAARRGHDDSMPPQLRTTEGRRAAIAKALAKIEEQKTADAAREGPGTISAARLRAEKTAARYEEAVAHHQEVSAAWEARRDAGQIPGQKPVATEDNVTVQKAKGVAERAQASYEKMLVPAAEGGKGRNYRANLTDADSALMKTRNGFVQGFNAQLVVSDDHLIVAADVTDNAADHDSYEPMVAAAVATAETVFGTTIGCVLADAGYCSEANLTVEGPNRLIATGSRRTLQDNVKDDAADIDSSPPDSTKLAQMKALLATPDGHRAYTRRGAVVEPVNGHLKDRRRLRQFSRRGLAAAKGELHLAAAVTNLARLFTMTAVTA